MGDFEAVYKEATELVVIDGPVYFSHVYELLVGVTWPDVTTLDRSVVPDIKNNEHAVLRNGCLAFRKVG